MKVVADGVTPNDLAVTRRRLHLHHRNEAQAGDAHQHARRAKSTPVDTGITKPNGIALSNDGGTLAVSDSGGDTRLDVPRESRWHARRARCRRCRCGCRSTPKGEFKFNEPPPYVAASAGDGMAVDKAGRYYVTSALGVQIFDPTGRPCGVLPKPNADQPLTTCILGGPRSQHALHCQRNDDLPPPTDGGIAVKMGAICRSGPCDRGAPNRN